MPEPYLQDAPLPTSLPEDVRFRRQMEQFFEVTTDAIIFLDRDYRFTFLNRRARELLAPVGEVLGTNLFETFPGAADPRSPYLQNYRRTMEEGLPSCFEAFYPEPLNLWMMIYTYPSDDGIMLFVRDVTQEKAAEKALRQKSDEAERQHAEIESVYRTAPIGLALFDAEEYRYLRLNERQAAFFGLKPEQVLGRTLTEMAPIEGLRELFDQVKRGEPVINFPLEGALVTDPENYRYWLVSYFPVFASDGSVQAITAASLEITQQKKAEEALIQSEKLAVVGRLASSIAHEINNPLEAVTNLLYLARRSHDAAELQDYLETAEQELRRVSVITTQTLRFHKQASSPQEISAGTLFESVLSVYQGRTLNARVEILERLRAVRPVKCFDGEIRQVISNLVSNALDALNPGGGALYLRSREGTCWSTGERGLVLTIADTGGGIPPEVMPHLFRAFFTTKGITGTGLGLWVSREIIARHRGVLRVRSRTQGPCRGTAFSIFLPFEAVTR